MMSIGRLILIRMYEIFKRSIHIKRTRLDNDTRHLTRISETCGTFNRGTGRRRFYVQTQRLLKASREAVLRSKVQNKENLHIIARQLHHDMRDAQGCILSGIMESLPPLEGRNRSIPLKD